MDRSVNLLDLALGFDDEQVSDPSPLSGKVVLIEDCVETSGSFVLHQIMKRVLSPHSSDALIFLAFARPLSHYDRVLRKLGCNLATQKTNNRLVFVDMLMMKCSDGVETKDNVNAVAKLFREIQGTVQKLRSVTNSNITVMVDDMSLLEIAATNSNSDHVLDFLHYCHSLISESNCSLVILNHEDIYSSMERPAYLLQMVCLADVVIKAEPLASGLANDVHGQLTVLNKGMISSNSGKGRSRNKLHNFQFRVKENGIEYFYPGCRS
ncbi:hypothetical protein Bca52824_001447 [Brassica carinata]|uniref:Elongator complex protein 6 n=1 Tax=Brassica carinata TaxID=52824 RepID=A0A8X8BDY1_BRACI|nr:hypothetical protein Bca52824_001447 [Brassica carinata]